MQRKTGRRKCPLGKKAVGSSSSSTRNTAKDQKNRCTYDSIPTDQANDLASGELNPWLRSRIIAYLRMSSQSEVTNTEQLPVQSQTNHEQVLPQFSSEAKFTDIATPGVAPTQHSELCSDGRRSRTDQVQCAMAEKQLLPQRHTHSPATDAVYQQGLSSYESVDQAMYPT